MPLLQLLRLKTTLLTTLLVLPGICAAAEPILWPIEGHFPAYPTEFPEDAFDILLRVGGTYDDNFLRLSATETPPPILEGDKAVASGHAGGGFDFRTGASLQRFRVQAMVDQYWYEGLTFLDHLRHQGDASWQWAIGDALTGEMVYSNSRSLADFGDLQEPIKDLVSRQYAYVSAGFSILPVWRLRAAVSGSQFEHSEVTRQHLDQNIKQGTAGFEFGKVASNTFGVQYSISEGWYPNRDNFTPLVPLDDRYKQYEGTAILKLNIGADSHLDLGVGHTRRVHEDLSIRDFSGITGHANLQLAPTNKVLLLLNVYREVQSAEDLAASYIVADGVSFGPAWAPTLKSVLQFELVYEKRSLEGDPDVVSGVEVVQSDITRTARVSGGYSPTDGLQFVARYEFGNRSSSFEPLTYDYNSAGLDVVFRF
ncbi:MAG: hypothetical protein H7Y02_08630 [Candidatus Obscuribacterales bacterium]|nr:hypothetical protein [Steroidobacteraceae bacterium]